MKKIILTLCSMMSVMSSFAQQTTVEGSKLFDNTSVSLYGGAMGWIDPAVTNGESFLNGVRPNFGAALDKWFTPVVGLEAYYEASMNSFPYNEAEERTTVFDFMNLNLNGQLNLNNMFHRYKGQPDRVEVVPFAGLGWGRGWTSRPDSYYTTEAYTEAQNGANFLTADAGAKVNINLGGQRAWQINVRPAINWILAGEGQNVQLSAQKSYVTLQVGLTYKFGHKNSTGKKTHNFTSAYTVADYDGLMAKYNEKPKEVKVEKIVEKTVEVEKIVEKPVEVVKVAYAIPAPHFVKNSTDIDATTAACLDVLVNEMKENSEIYNITGYASEDGDEAYNQKLSLKRANAVRDYLVKAGIDADRLEVVGAGETVAFGETYEPNRRVVVTKK